MEGPGGAACFRTGGGAMLLEPHTALPSECHTTPLPPPARGRSPGNATVPRRGPAEQQPPGRRGAAAAAAPEWREAPQMRHCLDSPLAELPGPNTLPAAPPAPGQPDSHRLILFPELRREASTGVSASMGNPFHAHSGRTSTPAAPSPAHSFGRKPRQLAAREGGAPQLPTHSPTPQATGGTNRRAGCQACKRRLPRGPQAQPHSGWARPRGKPLGPSGGLFCKQAPTPERCLSSSSPGGTSQEGNPWREARQQLQSLPRPQGSPRETPCPPPLQTPPRHIFCTALPTATGGSRVSLRLRMSCCRDIPARAERRSECAAAELQGLQGLRRCSGT